MGGWLDEIEDDDIDVDLDQARQLRGEYGVSDDRAYELARTSETTGQDVNELLD